MVAVSTLVLTVVALRKNYAISSTLFRSVDYIHSYILSQIKSESTLTLSSHFLGFWEYRKKNKKQKTKNKKQKTKNNRKQKQKQKLGNKAC